MSTPVMDVDAFVPQYAEWFARVKPLLEQKKWGDAFTGGKFPTPINADAPWTPVTKPLAQCRLGLVSTAGLYLEGEQPAFDAENIEGDSSFRELPRDVDLARLKIAHTHYNHESADKDRNAVFPLDRLHELEADGVIGSLAAQLFSTSGYCTRLDRIATETAPAIVARMKALQVDAVLHIPV